MITVLLWLSSYVPMNLNSDFQFGYDLENPSLAIELPAKLTEISGIGLSSDGQNLVAVQDEDGIIFFIDKNSGEIRQEIEFWKGGDYEGAEMVGSDIFVVKSTGTIYKISAPGSDQQKVDKFNFFLDKDNDVEGLCFDPSRNCLLLACKDKAGSGEQYKRKKGIYAFSLDQLNMDSVPVFTFSMEDVLAYLETKPKINRLDKIIEFFDPSSDQLPFSPSGIAIHPMTGDIYITSSVGKLLLIMNRKGKILHIEKMRKSVHPQPEGLCFDSNGDLYIANEGKDDKAMLYRFDYQN